MPPEPLDGLAAVRRVVIAFNSSPALRWFEVASGFNGGQRERSLTLALR